MSVETEAKSTEALSLAARIDQLEAAIRESHSILDRIQSQDTAKDNVPTGEGAAASLVRCQDEVADLNKRLNIIADKVGML